MMRKAAVGIAVIVAVLTLLYPVLASQGKKQADAHGQEDIQIATELETLKLPATQRAEESREGQVISRLTGRWVPEEVGNRRPVAVMLSNVQEACPQTGIALADIIYEAPVEGALTRLMGLFENYDALDKIGSVRSSRNYYVYYAAEYDAVYAHYGQSKFAEPLLETSNIDNLSGLESVGNTVYYRTSDRKAPHNAYASAEGIRKGIEAKSYRTDYEEAYEGHFQFAAEEDGITLESGMQAVKVAPGYQINKPYFTYTEEDGLYYRYQYGEKQVDDRDDIQLSCKNIILQYTESDMYDYQCLNLNISNTGNGVYITNGQAINITWQKESEWGKTTYYDENGEEITLNPGKTWICIIQSSKSDSVEIS